MSNRPVFNFDFTNGAPSQPFPFGLGGFPGGTPDSFVGTAGFMRDKMGWSAFWDSGVITGTTGLALPGMDPNDAFYTQTPTEDYSRCLIFSREFATGGIGQGIVLYPVQGSVVANTSFYSPAIWFTDEAGINDNTALGQSFYCLKAGIGFASGNTNSYGIGLYKYDGLAGYSQVSNTFSCPLSGLDDPGDQFNISLIGTLSGGTMSMVVNLTDVTTSHSQSHTFTDSSSPFTTGVPAIINLCRIPTNIAFGQVYANTNDPLPLLLINETDKTVTVQFPAQSGSTGTNFFYASTTVGFTPGAGNQIYSNSGAFGQATFALPTGAPDVYEIKSIQKKGTTNWFTGRTQGQLLPAPVPIIGYLSDHQGFELFDDQMSSQNSLQITLNSYFGCNLTNGAANHAVSVDLSVTDTTLASWLSGSNFNAAVVTANDFKVTDILIRLGLVDLINGVSVATLLANAQILAANFFGAVSSLTRVWICGLSGVDLTGAACGGFPANLNQSIAQYNSQINTVCDFTKTFPLSVNAHLLTAGNVNSLRDGARPTAYYYDLIAKNDAMGILAQLGLLGLASPVPPSGPLQVYAVTATLDAQGTAKPNVPIFFTQTLEPGSAGYSYDSGVQVINSDSSGNWSNLLVAGATYNFWRGSQGSAKSVSVPVPFTNFYLPAIDGPDDA